MFTEHFRILGDPVLTQICAPIEVFDDRLKLLASSMSSRLAEDQAGIGLAANQVGVLRHIFVYDDDYIDVGVGGVGGVFVNPRIVESGTAISTYEEGCLSIPGFFYPVDRPSVVTVQGESLSGKTFDVRVDGLAARLFQHEIDHLNGLTMFDRIAPDQIVDAYDELDSLRAGRVARRRVRRRFSL
jgi:peptide deformylase